MKIRPVFTMPGKPRGRGLIKRPFETVNQTLLDGPPGYLGPDHSVGRSKLTNTFSPSECANYFIAAG